MGELFGTARRGLGGLQSRPVPSAVPNVTAHPSTASVPITVLLYDGPLLCGFNVAIKGLTRPESYPTQSNVVPAYRLRNVLRERNLREFRESLVGRKTRRKTDVIFVYDETTKNHVQHEQLRSVYNYMYTVFFTQ